MLLSLALEVDSKRKKLRDVDCDVYACLIDFEKAFDTV